MCLRADATTSAIHVRLILPGECHGDYPPRLCHTPFTRIWPHEELCRFSALDHCSAPFSRACWLALAPPTLLGRGSRHCHGINSTHSYERGCQEKKLLPAPGEDAGVVTYIQPHRVLRGVVGLAALPRRTF